MKKVRLTFNDWPMEGQGLYGHYRRREVFDVVKVTKAGLLQIRDADGNLYSVPKRNTESADEQETPW